MKKRYLLLALACLAVACAKTNHDPQDGPEAAFAITPPAVPSVPLVEMSLTQQQQGYVQAGNAMSFRLLKQLARETATSYVCSPLSLQLALAMLANGTEGETLSEILTALGYGQEGLNALNLYARLLIQQLPALDLGVTFSTADALLVTDQYPLKTDFYNKLRNFYYAPAASVSFSNPGPVLNLVNDWASRSTEGLINPILEDIDPNTVALLLNALYFKAPWQKKGSEPMFDPSATTTGVFHRSASEELTVSFMHTTQQFQYADMGTYEVVSIPYASGKFFMHILLPKEQYGLYSMLDKLMVATPWSNIAQHLQPSAKRIHLVLPKFDISGDFNLNLALGALGIHRIFDETQAQFGPMFDVADNHGFYVSRVLQKARMSVAEWGTEAAAVTAVEVTEKSSGMPDITVKADHPFVFLIGGKDADAPILFGGVFVGVQNP